MSIRTIAIATAAAVVIGIGGYFAGNAIEADSAAEAPSEAAASPAPAPATTPVETMTVAQLSEAQRNEVEGIVKDYLAKNPGFIRDYLLANPEVIRDAIDELQRKQDAEEQAAQVAAIGDNRELLFSSPRQVVMGNPNGDVTLIEFFDYNCGYCRRAHPDMQQLIADDPNLKVVLKEFPVLGDGSIEAAQVSIAVRIVAPEKAGEFFDALISQSGQVDGNVALAVAEELGLDRAKLEETMNSDEVKETITEVYALAQKLSLTGTPSYVTTEEVVIGAIGYDALKEKIAAARASCTTEVC
ncbi:MAG TPA: DsbA family protein [Bauldia sp.]|nr:DsbA family protein [Bauldia sp.]